MTSRVKGLTPESFETLRREIGALKRQLANQERRLATVSTRRHEAVWVPQSGLVDFRNDNSGTAPAYGVMRVTGGATVGGKDYVTVDQPNTTFLRKYLVNTGRDVTTGKYGKGVWLEDSDFVLYDSGDGTPAYGESWGPKSGQWTLAKWRYGFTIVGPTKGSGSTLRVCAWQEEVNSFWGQTDGTLTKGSTGTIEVYDGNDAQISSTTVTGVKNKFATVADNKKVGVYWWGGSWYAIAAEC